MRLLVRLETVRGAKRFLATIFLAGIRLLTGVRAFVRLKVMRCSECLATIVLGTLVWTLLCVGAHMLLQVTQRGETLLTKFTIEGLSIVQTQVSVQSDEWVNINIILYIYKDKQCPQLALSYLYRVLNALSQPLTSHS